MPKELYDPTQSELQASDTSYPSRKGMNIKGTIFSLSAVWLLFGTRRVLPQFAETFTSFGVDLPLITQLALGAKGLFGFMAFLALIIFLCWIVSMLASFHQSKAYRITKYYFFIAVSIFLATLVSMYLPIFQLGDIV